MFKNFDDLFILDLANNHFGNLNHAKKIVSKFSKINKRHNLKCAFKFQYRDLPNFVHKDFRDSKLKYVRRFLDTKMSDEKFNELFKFIRKNGFLTSCTPFDEASVDKIEKNNFDIIKVASVSSLDFNLHERLVKNKIPKIISTGGIAVNDIDNIVSFYLKKNQKFAIMHCVSIYPSEHSDLNLKFIKNIKKRYRNIPIGWSTHERPDEFIPATLAHSYGARIFEKHVGIKSKTFKLNEYSTTPELFEEWYLNLKKSIEMSGLENKKIYNQEKRTIESLSRGVYLKNDIKKNTLLTNKNTYFAIPLQENQLSSVNFKGKMEILIDSKKDQSIKISKVAFDKNLQQENLINKYLHSVKATLNYNNIQLGKKFSMEISHHEGINNFKKVGCFLFNILNRNYAKKILVMLPNQRHPSHHHKNKTESFIILSGNLELKDGKKNSKLNPGDVIHLKKKSWHEFKAGNNGCVFEEISTYDSKKDSFYKNKDITKLPRNTRKTYFNNWFQLQGYDS